MLTVAVAVMAAIAIHIAQGELHSAHYHGLQFRFRESEDFYRVAHRCPGLMGHHVGDQLSQRRRFLADGIFNSGKLGLLFLNPGVQFGNFARSFLALGL